MSSAPQPPDPETLARRPFSFYPPILNIDRNEWVFREASWSEIRVSNTSGGLEVWIPRRFLGEVSRVEEPVMIVGLQKELEYQGGSVWPHERRVVQMPRLPGDAPPPPVAAPPTLTHPRKAPDSPEKRIGKLLAGVLLFVVAGLGALMIFSQDQPRASHVRFTSRDQSFLELTGADDYNAVVRKLGTPAQDRWRTQSGELQYRLLAFPSRGYSILLMGTERDQARYIGALDQNWRVVHYVEIAKGASTASLLRALPKF